MRRAELLADVTVREGGERRLAEDESHPPARRRRAQARRRGVRRLPGVDPARQAPPAGHLLRAPRRGRQERLRDRLGRAPGVQPADRGRQPGPRQRRAAVDEAGQRAGDQPVRGPRRGRALLRPRGAPHRGQPAGAAEAHRPAAGPHRARRGRVRRRGGLAVRGGPGLELPDRARPDRRGRRPARPRDREDPLRLRRGQRRGPRRLPGRVGDPALAAPAPQGVHRRG